MNKLMTTDEVANLLGVKPTTIGKWVRLQEIPVVRLWGIAGYERL